MPIPLNQRWLFRRDKYRPAGETIRTADYSVEPIGETAAKDFVVMHHYSGTYPAARFRFGLFRGSKLAGVAVFSQPCSDRVLTNVFRGVRATDAAGGGSFCSTPFLATARHGSSAAHSKRSAPKVSPAFSPSPIQRRGGTPTASLSSRDTSGRSIRRTTAHTSAGRTLDRSTSFQTERSSLTGRCRRSARESAAGATRRIRSLAMVPRGSARKRDRTASCAPLGFALREALRVTTRGLRHPGNHRYAWGLTRAMRRSLDGRAYPKVLEAA
jgi:hypothetical protein